MPNNNDAGRQATTRVTAGPGTGIGAGDLRPGALTGSQRRYLPGPPVGSRRVRVERLAEPSYRNRRVRFAGVVGRVVGIAQTAALGLGADGRAHSASGPRVLVLTDAANTDHHLPFTSQDEADILD